MELKYKNLILLISLFFCQILKAQHNSGYFSQRELQQQQRERDRWMSNLQNSASQPNPSSSTPYYMKWYNNPQPEPEPEPQLTLEQERKLQEERAKADAAWRASVAAAQEAERKRQYELWLQRKNNTDLRYAEIKNTREKYAAEVQAKNAGAFALLGIVSYPLLKQSRWYFEQAFKQNPSEYAILPAISDFLNHPFPDSQDSSMRVIKLAEISSHSSYVPFKLYSCAILQKAFDKLKLNPASNSRDRAISYANKIVDQCVDSLPEKYRNSESYKFLISSAVHLYPGSRSFWENTNDGLDVTKLKEKFAVMPEIGLPQDYLQDEKILN